MPHANIRIVLVEPAGPLNVGSVARVMKNMGLHQLILVNPQCDYLGEEARLMAVRAADILETATVVESLPAALVGCVRAIATTGDDGRSHPMPLESPADALPWLLEAPSALIFGREDCGLTNAELNRAQRLIRIPSSDAYTSLNLAQAVAICCYELYRDEDFRRKREEGRGKKEEGSSATDSVTDVTDTRNQEEGIFSQSPPLPLSQSPPLPIPPSPPLPNSAPLEQLEGYYQQLEGLLLKIGYLQPHTAASRMEKFRRLYNRAYPTVDEVAMLRGAIRQTEWGLKSYPRSPVSDTLDGALPENPTDS
ncbi:MULTISPECIES: RNA methyltransferase [unclassified Microcoleus]|uniref:RNA methyltransferase n=1 Tax=unclassified Microcoleus TaxID=2642155 RepID=UPI001E19053F|nr:MULTISPECIES: RNA methyltransferase [unclassified Microcoleus]TAE10846.1 MAG: RNA methyltransferase [Oscillatoriales cyanobacterium]MCC3414308.1 RNA methyltransferase [Microcoleus sp. PH2017_02_FOX_O_A]MCC3491907.1 RNA methyltransferase [Microcoleus sp. PH2017_16_JOR_D_A]MCC3537331.1 RNA methyltransferase [Microcoleus sp. PH2017_25_DOB_D_A]MCC3549607.1 RNA methyltransferase [Microcoleus sp. PH2017_24_DOB_U_A]